MSQNREGRGRETGNRRAEAEDRTAESDRQPADALTDEDARTPDTAPTEEEPAWRAPKTSGSPMPGPPAD
ncbi:hypothetical protein DLE60_08000 [Micromonospora globispora]|uniref:Uncharacterized protein n=1 Tax=Micromonospora globispora TaxID=1450148 RepID=A0A317K7U2_9ACTN|nr:hypothetical protein DLJ46_09490 [Micromonospora globispora]PWU61005.1 hypothetical protein DLE60_08000 [Micromonospora globispora]RQW94966.1 hypothetical protein DKL51_15365 [Micromonospora globispora]